MRVLIYGGRDWRNQVRLSEALDALHSEHRFTHVINGGQVSRDRATRTLFGADWEAVVWAGTVPLPVSYFWANWALEGKSAGPIRNQRMLVEGKPDLGVQFPGGAGTRDMRRRLDAAGIRVVEVEYDP